MADLEVPKPALVGRILTFYCPHCGTRVEIGGIESALGKAQTERDEAVAECARLEAEVALLRKNLASEAVIAERDAAVAALAALEQRIADAPRETKWYPERMQRGTYALLLLGDDK